MSDINFHDHEAKNPTSSFVDRSLDHKGFSDRNASNAMVNTEFPLSPHERLNQEEKATEKIRELSRLGSEQGIYPRAAIDAANRVGQLIEHANSLQKRGILPAFSIKSENSKDSVGTQTNVAVEVSK